MRITRILTRLAGFALLGAGLGVAVAMDRAEALRTLDSGPPEVRAEALRELAEHGEPEDAARLIPLLADRNALLRAEAQSALWRVWSRSGDAAVDVIFERGLAQMQSGELRAAEASFGEIVRRKPEFAEGWNKRATVRYLLGELRASLADCDEVLRRNPQHFAAMTGAGQIHARLGQAEQALQMFERALAINPYLLGVPEAIEALRAHLRSQPQTRT